MRGPRAERHLLKEVEWVVEAAHVSTSHAAHSILQARLPIPADDTSCQCKWSRLRMVRGHITIAMHAISSVCEEGAMRCD